MESFNQLQKEIVQYKKEKNALILAHYYVPIEVQDIADHVCDSFAMAKLAKRAQQQLIVICGVRFMGESAKILSPNKKVLLPAPDAGCPMADTVTSADVLRLRKAHPKAAVVCYVNSSASVKAVSDICCTSSSALKVVRSLEEEEIIFVPDIHLGSFIAAEVPEKRFILYDGYCPTHHEISENDVLKAKKSHPDAVFAVHPECRDEVIKYADFVGSTAEILDFAKNTLADEILIGTEVGVTERLIRELPNKKVYSVSAEFICSNMKKVGLEEVRDCLKYEQYEVTLSIDEIKAAQAALDRMVNI